MPIKNSELILNSDGSVYHLCLKPKNIAHTIILVGDPDRVEEVTKHFDDIEFSIQKREFKTQTGYYKGKHLTVLSTGIGADNIDIVLNELDALVNINLQTRLQNKNLKSLNFIRIGTSGTLQKDIVVDSFLISTHAIDLNGMLHAYNTNTICNKDIEDQFIAHTQWSTNKAKPIIIKNDSYLETVFEHKGILKGATATLNGFYGPQGRTLRLKLKDESLNLKLKSFNYNTFRITNFEMETSAIYGLAKLLGHKAISLNAILANRTTGTFSCQPQKTIEDLIVFALERIKHL